MTEPTERELRDLSSQVLVDFMPMATFSEELSSFGGQGYAHVLVAIVPRMLESGVPQLAIGAMLIDQPAHVLSLEP